MWNTEGLARTQAPKYLWTRKKNEKWVPTLGQARRGGGLKLNAPISAQRALNKWFIGWTDKQSDFPKLVSRPWSTRSSECPYCEMAGLSPVFWFYILFNILTPITHSLLETAALPRVGRHSTDSSVLPWEALRVRLPTSTSVTALIVPGNGCTWFSFSRSSAGDLHPLQPPELPHPK